jgi:hypothetical protein
MVLIHIVRGWTFHSADFSLNAARGPTYDGRVTLTRDVDEKRRWYAASLHVERNTSGELPPDFPPLYVTGYGPTLEAAIANANRIAAFASPIL